MELRVVGRPGGQRHRGVRGQPHVDAAVCYYGGNIYGNRDLRPQVPTMLHFAEKDTFIPIEHAHALAAQYPELPIYTYPAEPTVPAPSPAAGTAPTMVQYLTESDALDPLIERIKAAGIKVQSRKEDDPYGAGMLRAGNATICLTDGRTATQIAFEEDLTNVLTLDLARDFATTKRVALAKGEDTTTSAVADAVALFKALGVEVTMVGDVPGMIVARTVAMLANEAADAVLQGVADAAGVDTAMKLGVSYPEGPLAAADRYGLTLMNAVLVNMQAHTGDDRYRQSLLLQRKMWSDGSFT